MTDKQLVVVSGLVGTLFGNAAYDTISSRHFVVESTAELDECIQQWRDELGEQHLVLDKMLAYTIPQLVIAELLGSRRRHSNGVEIADRD